MKYELPEYQVRIALKEGTPIYGGVPMNHPSAAINAVKDYLTELDREMLLVVLLDTQLKPIGYHVASIGTTDYCVTNVPCIFKAALLTNATNLMLFHNHPSGNPEPSDFDITLTKKMAEAGKLLDIPIVEHIIVGGMSNEFYSFHERMPEILLA